MKPIDDLDHYEVLEVPPGAGYEDIERAYQMTRAAYTNGSLALYSIFSTDDASVIRNRIDEAYRILGDPKTRERYDAEAGVTAEQPAPSSNESTRAASAAPALEASALEVESRSGAAPPEVSTALAGIEDIDAEIDEEQREFDGAALRRARLRRGVELDQISDVTKVRVKFLKCIEEEAFDKLPTSVYIRGFVHAYARAIGLDARRVASSYMVRVDAARSQPKHPPRSTYR
jgi:curved DNA-binding protein CbpA